MIRVSRMKSMILSIQPPKYAITQPYTAEMNTVARPTITPISREVQTYLNHHGEHVVTSNGGTKPVVSRGAFTRAM